MTDDLSKLIERVEKATGPDRGIDGLVAYCLGWAPHFDLKSEDLITEWALYAGHWLAPQHNKNKRRPLDCACTSDRYFTEPPEYTSSLDAVIALVEREMPDASFSICKDGEYEAHVDVKRNSMDSPMYFEEAPTPALALLLVFLRANQQESRNGK